MIKGHCWTNLDRYRTYEWPQVFPAVPRIGERVRATGSRVRLYVVDITYYEVRNDNGGYEPRVEIELHEQTI